MNNFINSLTTVRDRLYNESNLLMQDKPFIFANLITDPANLLTWNSVEECLNNPVFYNFDIIDSITNDKIKIPEYKKAWIFNKAVQDKKFLFEQLHHGNTLIINNYGFHSKFTNEFLKMIETVFYTDAAMHVYCGLGGSKSFSVHEDIPSNFILQIEGVTSWTVFENRSSTLVASGYRPTAAEIQKFTPALTVDLHPGDLLYIPSRAYHVAQPTTKRLSISIPCWPKFGESKDYSIDRNQYSISQI
jgi:hypothetical protein